LLKLGSTMACLGGLLYSFAGGPKSIWFVSGAVHQFAAHKLCWLSSRKSEKEKNDDCMCLYCP